MVEDRGWFMRCDLNWRKIINRRRKDVTGLGAFVKGVLDGFE